MQWTRHGRSTDNAVGEGGCEILNDVVLNQVLVSFGDPTHARHVIEAVQRDGTCWSGPLNGKIAPRCASACRPGRRAMKTSNGASTPSWRAAGA